MVVLLAIALPAVSNVVAVVAAVSFLDVAVVVSTIALVELTGEEVQFHNASNETLALSKKDRA